MQAKTSEKAQEVIDNFIDKLAEKYGLDEVLNAPVYPETFKSARKTKLTNIELQQLQDLFKARDTIDSKDLDKWRETVKNDIDLPKEEKEIALNRLGFGKGKLAVPFTGRNLRNWNRDLLYNIENLYNLFAHSKIPYESTYAKFRWGGTGDNPILEGSVYGEELTRGEWNYEALKKTQKVINAISKTQGIEPINLLKEIKLFHVKQLMD